MSGLFKSLGKIFKKVIKVLKKIALPALAIAAVVVTGGAALGLLPGIAGLGGLAASLGASPFIAGVLSAAGTGATIGAIGGLLTTGSLKGAIKGASIGFLTGGIAGGIGQALGGVAGAVPSGASGASDVLNSGVYSGVEGIDALTGAADVAGQAAGGIGGIGGAVTSGAGMSAAGTSAASGGGVLGFLNSNPLLLSGVMKGIGGALMGDPRMNELKALQHSYDGVIPYKPYDVGSIDGLQSPDERYNTIIYGQGKYEYDPITGRVIPAKQGG